MKLMLSRHTHNDPVVRFLDERLFPWVVALMTSRPHIIFVLLLIAVVENPTTATVLMLMAGNWLNIVGASASAIVLRQQSNQHEEVVERHNEHEDRFQQILERLNSIEQRLSTQEAP